MAIKHKILVPFLLSMNKSKGCIFLFLLFLTRIGYTCPCDSTKTTADYIAGANQIFVGTVVGVNTNWMSGGMKYSFSVDKTWKREADRLLVINTGWKYECGFEFVEGKKYLVYGLKKFSLKTSECMGTKAYEDAETDLLLLGEGKAPRKSKLVPVVGWIMGGMVVFGMLFLAFVIFRKNGQKT